MLWSTSGGSPRQALEAGGPRPLTVTAEGKEEMDDYISLKRLRDGGAEQTGTGTQVYPSVAEQIG